MPKSYLTKWIGKKQYRVHRLIMEKHLKRKLYSQELVHHINGDIHDNRIKNLEIVSRSEHKKLHPEIGENSRFKKKYFINKNIVLEKFKSMTIMEIGKELGCSSGVIQKIIKDNKLRDKIRCSVCEKFAEYRRTQLCSKHYLKLYYNRIKIKVFPPNTAP